MEGKKEYRIVLVRHGESEWNKLNVFTGWHDVQLNATGLKEAKEAGELFKKLGLTFDKCYTSLLTRAINTLDVILLEMGQSYLPVEKRWRLNERMYGGLTGLNKAECAKEHGDQQVLLWRRSFDVCPPPLDLASPYHPLKDSRYKHVPRVLIPSTESLKTCIERVLPCWYDEICPDLMSGKNLLVSIHGNSIRALLKVIQNLGEEGNYF